MTSYYVWKVSTLRKIPWPYWKTDGSGFSEVLEGTSKYGPTKVKGNVRFEFFKRNFIFCLDILHSFSQQLNGQKQPQEVFCVKGCSYKFHKIHRKTPVPEPLFNKVTGLRPATLLKKRLRRRCFPVNFVKFIKIPFYRTPQDDCD